MVIIEKSDFPWLVTVPIPAAVNGDKDRIDWRRKFLTWLRDQQVEFLWHGMTPRAVVVRVRTEEDAMLIKLKMG